MIIRAYGLAMTGLEHCLLPGGLSEKNGNMRTGDHKPYDRVACEGKIIASKSLDRSDLRRFAAPIKSKNIVFPLTQALWETLRFRASSC